jgi:hypothetical protein
MCLKELRASEAHFEPEQTRVSNSYGLNRKKAESVILDRHKQRERAAAGTYLPTG